MFKSANAVLHACTWADPPMNPFHALWPKPASTTRLVLVRHGETPWNVEQRFQGHTDIGLNQRGIEQAHKVHQAMHLAHTRLLKDDQGPLIDACYSSDLSRAQHTAQIIRPDDTVPVQLLTGLRERHYGDFSGLTSAEMAQKDPNQFQIISQRQPDGPVKDGESLRQFNTRVMDAVTAILQQHTGQTVLVVAHGGVLDCIYRHAQGIDLAPKRAWLLPNCALNVMDQPPGQGLQVRLWADTHHLDLNTSQPAGDEVDGRVA